MEAAIKRRAQDFLMTDARIAKTRAALAEAVLALAGEKDFGDVTIAEIAQRAGIGYATFFRHYTDKDALLSDVAEVLVDELIGLILPALLAEDTLTASIALCRFVDGRRTICRALLAGGAEAAVRRELIERTAERAEALHLPQPEGLPASLLIMHAVTATVGLLGWWLEHEGIDATAMGAIINRLVMAPVRGD
jgi:AcrR family transcriptional regulator